MSRPPFIARGGERPRRIVVATAHDANYRDMAAITLPSVQRYCARHGYELWYDDDIDPREGDACKIRIFRDLYASGEFAEQDLFFWIDTDALVMNADVQLEALSSEYLLQLEALASEYLLEFYHYVYHYLVGYDPNGINTGTWLAPFTSRAEHFLRVAQQTSFSMGWADQVGLFQTALQPTFREIVRYVPGKLMNSMLYELYGWEHWTHGNQINRYEPGDFVLHVPALELATRLQVLRQYAELAT